MKTGILVLLSGVISLFASAQEYRNGSLQPDSVYKANKVHTRIGVHLNSPSKSRDIFVFDNDGRTLLRIITDNETGNRPLEIMHYSYNSKGVLTNEADASFRKDRYAAEYSEMTYAGDGSLATLAIKNSGHIIRKSFFYTDENKIVEKSYYNDTVYREDTSFYDKQGNTIRYKGKEFANPKAQPTVITSGGKSYTFNPLKTDMVWDYTYVNTYDSAGNLILQLRYENGHLKDKTNFKMGDHGLWTSLNDSIFSYSYY